MQKTCCDTQRHVNVIITKTWPIFLAIFICLVIHTHTHPTLFSFSQACERRTHTHMHTYIRRTRVHIPYIKIIFIAMHKPLLRGNGKVIYANNKTLAPSWYTVGSRRTCLFGWSHMLPTESLSVCVCRFGSLSPFGECVGVCAFLALKKEGNQFSTPLGFAIRSHACTNK